MLKVHPRGAERKKGGPPMKRTEPLNIGKRYENYVHNCKVLGIAHLPFEKWYNEAFMKLYRIEN